MKKYYAWFDGSAKPNPGKIKIGGYIQDEAGKTIEEFSDRKGRGTNNLAEYLALYRICVLVSVHGIKCIEIKGDSQLIINQVNGDSKCKHVLLKGYRDGIRDLLRGVDYKLEHVYRDKNKKADSLTR